MERQKEKDLMKEIAAGGYDVNFHLCNDGCGMWTVTASTDVVTIQVADKNRLSALQLIRDFICR